MTMLAACWILASSLLLFSAVAEKAPDPVFAPIDDDPALPRVLLIGDSISIGYTLPVREMLVGKANVHRIPINGGDTVRGLEHIDEWLGDKPWDVIHFNWGLHDVKREKDGKPDVKRPPRRTPDEYAKNLDKLVRRLKKTDAVLIWAATTPVPEGASGRAKGDEVALNREAAKIMKKHGVKTNDLYGYILPQLKKAQRPRNVHFTDKGSEILAKKVVEEITAALKQAKSD